MKQSSGDDDVYTQYRASVLSNLKQAAKSLLREVQERFLNQPDRFAGFRLLLNDFASRRIDVGSLQVEVLKLFAGEEDLILKFNAFLPQDDEEEEEEENDEVTAEEEGGGGKLEEAIDFMNNVKIRFRNDEEVQAEFLHVMKHQQGQSLHELKRKVEALFHGHGDLIEEFDRVARENSVSLQPSTATTRANKKQKMMEKSVHELELSKCIQISPSYWMLPEEYRTSLGGERSQVLNNEFVCVSRDSGNYSCNYRQRNRQEEIMFRVEDDRFELDMLVEYTISAANRVGKLLNTIQKHRNCSVKEHLGARNLRYIERLYGDYGLDVIEYLYRNPETALPVILRRLQEKQDELIEFRSEFIKVSAEACAENQLKSQDKQLSSEKATEFRISEEDL
ncbi:Paired amphipathic helix SIN3-like protein [Melia azedarach]|uniref:Paired amphipathic helix SIN3-like protein n=1 Tax=Melia azedarach TaxID=155640 RepID=A0ACC1YGT2_MELAZ|nr:Paired amphipathic helix SIN3-like protein [Melia azedarach]